LLFFALLLQVIVLIESTPVDSDASLIVWFRLSFTLADWMNSCKLALLQSTKSSTNSPSGRQFHHVEADAISVIVFQLFWAKFPPVLYFSANIIFFY